jgi:hypothetical protein
LVLRDSCARALLSGKNLDSGAQTRKLLGCAMFRGLIGSKLAVCLLLPRRHSGASRNPLWSERKPFQFNNMASTKNGFRLTPE